jgi:hypothetical protein
VVFGSDYCSGMRRAVARGDFGLGRLHLLSPKTASLKLFFFGRTL